VGRWNTRQTALVLAAAAWTVAAAGWGVARAAPTHHPRRAAAAPIVIGFLDTMSGPLAEVGTDTYTGAQIAVKEINAHGGVLGHPLQLEVKDEEVSPTVTVQDMREYASQHVQFITGFTSSADCFAAVPIAVKNNMVIVSSACSDNGLQTTDFNPHLFTVASNTMQMAKAAAVFVKSYYPSVTLWDNMSYDYVTGHAFWADFQQQIKAQEPKVQFGKSVFFPLTATQVSSYITALLSSVPAGSSASAGLFLGTFGSGTIETAQQGEPYGLFQKFRLVLNVSGSEPTSATLGPKGPPIYYVQDYYYKAYHNPMNAYLVSAYNRLGGHPKFAGPDLWVEQGYTSIQVLAQAMVHAKSTDPTQVMRALTTTRFITPKGVAFIRSDHTMMSPETVWECKGDAHATIGYVCPFYVSIPTQEVAPPVAPH
jgi:branched-chain amino acid transport system substrate-binding protein